MNKVKSLGLALLMLTSLFSVQSFASNEIVDKKDDRVFRLVLLSSYFLPEITTYGPYTTMGGSFTSMRFTEMLERISYNISVDSRIDKKEILDLRDDSVEYLVEGHRSTTFEVFSDALREHEDTRYLSDEQVASIVIALSTVL